MNGQVYKPQDIRARFSQVVMEQMLQGKTLIETMAGHQGELMKVDLTDGKKIWRVLLEDKSFFAEEEEGTGRRFYGSKAMITVRRYDVNIRSYNRLNGGMTVWNGDGELEQTVEWFSVGERGTAYVENMSEAIDMQDKHHDRRAARGESKDSEINIDSDERRAKIKAVVRKHKGYKRARKKDLVSVAHVGKTFVIEFTKESGRMPLTVNI